MKSLKLYIWSFRSRGAFHEAVTNEILRDLVAATAPRFMRHFGQIQRARRHLHHRRGGTPSRRLGPPPPQFTCPKDLRIRRAAVGPPPPRYREVLLSNHRLKLRKYVVPRALYTPECVGIIARSFVRRRKIQMPSKKPNKAAKRPGKATPKKATHKAAAPKKAARPPTKAKPIATSKVTVKPSKSIRNLNPANPQPESKPVSAKPAITKAPHANPAALEARARHGTSGRRKSAAERIAPDQIRSSPAGDAAARAPTTTTAMARDRHPPACWRVRAM